ncbi:MAG: hypothetical protein SFV32_02155 [Opitutaceae bacterium]|nr:hypothetical protein [Opitutaceae bacterium]
MNRWLLGSLSGFMMLCSGACGTSSGKQRTFDRGYRQGASDAIKRQYWIKQRLEKAMPEDRSVYVVETPSVTRDGRKQVKGTEVVP